MRLTDKTERWSMGNKRYEGRKKGYLASIGFSAKNWMDSDEYWYFTLSTKDDTYSYNSLWDKLKYKSQEECLMACETKIDSLTKQNLNFMLKNNK